MIRSARKSGPLKAKPQFLESVFVVKLRLVSDLISVILKLLQKLPSTSLGALNNTFG